MPDRPGWLDEVGKAPAVVPATATRPAPLLLDDEHRPIATADGWKARRAQLVARWRTFLGAIPDSLDLAPHVVLESDRRDGVDRRLIRYEAGPGLPVEAYLLRPLDDAHEPPSRPRPGVVVLHSTIGYTIRQPAGLEGPSDHHLGLHLARRGYVALCPRCFLWQYSERGRIAEAVDWLHQRYPGVTGMSKMLADAMRAVDLLLGFPGVDARRIGAIGHSLGAKEVLYLAAFDPRVRASVSSEGGIGITYSNWDAPWYLGEAARRPGFPLDHGQVLALAAPRRSSSSAASRPTGMRAGPTSKPCSRSGRFLGLPTPSAFSTIARATPSRRNH